MKIELKKFGESLLGRKEGRESFLAIRPLLEKVGKDEKVFIDFLGVSSLAPSWADEFLKSIKEVLPIDKIVLVNIKENEPVLYTINFLEETNKEKYNIE